MEKGLLDKGSQAVKFCIMHHLLTPRELESLIKDSKKLETVSKMKRDLHLIQSTHK